MAVTPISIGSLTVYDYTVEIKVCIVIYTPERHERATTMTTRYELIITTDNDAHSGIYDTYTEARAAADDAADVDGLTVDVKRWTTIGTATVGAEGVFVNDDDGLPWFEFRIERTDQ